MIFPPPLKRLGEGDGRHVAEASMTQTLDETNCSDLRLISDASAGPCVTAGRGGVRQSRGGLDTD